MFYHADEKYNLHRFFVKSCDIKIFTELKYGNAKWLIKTDEWKETLLIHCLSIMKFSRGNITQDHKT